MARLCGKCGGSGWVGARTDFGHKPGGPCRTCDGSGRDKRWGEKGCKGCSNMIEYRYDWSSIPDYCESCKRDQYKACENPYSNGSVRYKKPGTLSPNTAKFARVARVGIRWLVKSVVLQSKLTVIGHIQPNGVMPAKEKVLGERVGKPKIKMVPKEPTLSTT